MKHIAIKIFLFLLSSFMGLVFLYSAYTKLYPIEPFEYTFTITPPWWHAWWFRGIMTIALVIILLLLYRWRTAALRERQKVLEKTVEQRTEELVQKNIIVEYLKIKI